MAGETARFLKVGQELSKQHCSLSDPSPTYSTTTKLHGLPCLGKCLRLLPLQHNRYTKTKKYGPNERRDQNSEKELSDKEITDLSDAEFQTLVIWKLTELIEYRCKIKEEVKAIQSKIKKNIQGTKSEGKET